MASSDLIATVALVSSVVVPSVLFWLGARQRRRAVEREMKVRSEDIARLDLAADERRRERTTGALQSASRVDVRLGRSSDAAEIEVVNSTDASIFDLWVLVWTEHGTDEPLGSVVGAWHAGGGMRSKLPAGVHFVARNLELASAGRVIYPLPGSVILGVLIVVWSDGEHSWMRLPQIGSGPSLIAST